MKFEDFITLNQGRGQSAEVMITDHNLSGNLNRNIICNITISDEHQPVIYSYLKDIFERIEGTSSEISSNAQKYYGNYHYSHSYHGNFWKDFGFSDDPILDFHYQMMLRNMRIERSSISKYSKFMKETVREHVDRLESLKKPTIDDFMSIFYPYATYFDGLESLNFIKIARHYYNVGIIHKNYEFLYKLHNFLAFCTIPTMKLKDWTPVPFNGDMRNVKIETMKFPLGTKIYQDYLADKSLEEIEALSKSNSIRVNMSAKRAIFSSDAVIEEMNNPNCDDEILMHFNNLNNYFYAYFVKNRKEKDSINIIAESYFTIVHFNARILESSPQMIKFFSLLFSDEDNIRKHYYDYINIGGINWIKEVGSADTVFLNLIQRYEPVQLVEFLIALIDHRVCFTHARWIKFFDNFEVYKNSPVDWLENLI